MSNITFLLQKEKDSLVLTDDNFILPRGISLISVNFSSNINMYSYHRENDTLPHTLDEL